MGVGGEGAQALASPVWGRGRRGGDSKGDRGGVAWGVKGSREGAPPRGQVGKYSEGLTNGICDCYCQVRVEARITFSEAITYMPRASHPVGYFTDIIS